MNMSGIIPDKQLSLNVFDVLYKPRRKGVYLLLCFEWVGLGKDKPQLPSWDLKEWNGSHWSRKQYTFDTGCMENFQPLAWCDLPSADWPVPAILPMS
jgi:hypothetical protein